MSHKKAQTVLVAGAGPAGLTAALGAAQSGAHVVVCEKQPRAGAKLSASGGGRCNLTNTAGIESIATKFVAVADLRYLLWPPWDRPLCGIFSGAAGSRRFRPTAFTCIPLPNRHNRCSTPC